MGRGKMRPILVSGVEMKLFVGGLDFRTDETKIERLFVAAKITLLGCLIARDQERMSRCFGFVTVADVDTEAALKLSGKYLDGRPIKIKKQGSMTRRKRAAKRVEQTDLFR